MSRYLSKLRDFGKNTPNPELTELTKVEQLQNATVLPLQNATKTVLSVLSVHPQAHFSQNDPGPVAPRWRITRPDGRTFEVSCYPSATRQDVLAQEPMGTQAEPISMSMSGSLPHEDLEIIEAVCSAWGATPDETQDAIAEASSNPALMDGWRGETEKLADSGLTELTKGVLSVLSVHPQAYFSEAPMPDDRIYCQQCRLLRPSGLCGSPAWGPRYHPPAPSTPMW